MSKTHLHSRRDVLSWALLLLASVLGFFAPAIIRVALESTMTQKQRENRKRYEEEVRKQGIK